MIPAGAFWFGILARTVRRGGNLPPGVMRAAVRQPRESLLPQGALSMRDAPPIVVVAKSAKLRFRLRRKLRLLPCTPRALPRPLRGLGRSSSPHRAGRGGGPFSVLPEKKTGRARSKRKARFWSQLCTHVQSCCTGVDERWYLRVCGDRPTGAAGCRADLAIDSRGADAEDIGVQERI